MPKQSGKSGLMAKLGNKIRTAHEAHKGDDTTLNTSGELPPGIEMGVAELVDCRFTQIKEGKKNAGEYMFYAAGIVVEPAEITVDGRKMPVKGLRTSITEPLYDTPQRKSRQTVEDHYAYILTVLRSLGLDTSEVDADNIEESMQALVEAKPHFRFRTWQGEPTKDYPNPMVNHQWMSAVEYTPADDDGGVVDDSASEPAEAPSTSAKGSGKGPGGKAPPAEDVPFGDDLDALADAAANDEYAAARLSELATEAGVPESEVESADSWDAVADMIRAARAGGGGEEEAGGDTEDAPDYAALGEQADGGDDDAIATLTAAAEEAGIEHESVPSWSEVAAMLAGGGEEAAAQEPSKGEVWFYQMKDPKTKRTKKVECDVTAVFKKNRTVHLTNLDTKKVIMDPKTKKPLAVSWDDITPE